MNKQDIILSIVVVIIGLIIYGVLNIFQTDSEIANVYYDNKKVLTINLNDGKNDKYIVNGYNGEVVIIKENGKIRVVSENSPRHLCSKQGFISKSYESIICLPNKVVIEIDSGDELDTIAR